MSQDSSISFISGANWRANQEIQTFDSLFWGKPGMTLQHGFDQSSRTFFFSRALMAELVECQLVFVRYQNAFDPHEHVCAPSRDIKDILP